MTFPPYWTGYRTRKSINSAICVWMENWLAAWLVGWLAHEQIDCHPNHIFPIGIRLCFINFFSFLHCFVFISCYDYYWALLKKYACIHSIQRRGKNCSLPSFTGCVSWWWWFSQSIDAVATASAIAVARLYPNMNNFPIVGIVFAHNGWARARYYLCKIEHPERKRNRKQHQKLKWEREIYYIINLSIQWNGMELRNTRQNSNQIEQLNNKEQRQKRRNAIYWLILIQLNRYIG